MTSTATPQVQLIAKTEFFPPPDVPWSTDADGGQALTEFAGRACYQSWSKPNPATATNAGYVRHILEVGHLSVLEHSSVSFYMTGISRSLTHELIRHRHFSYSQLSQRYVDESDAEFVVPPALTQFGALESFAADAFEYAQAAYRHLVMRLDRRLAQAHPDMSATARRKATREAARAVLPNGTETRIVVTGNYRSWRHFIAIRATEHADVEIRGLAVECLRQLQKACANIFADFTITTLPDGTEVAASEMGAET